MSAAARLLPPLIVAATRGGIDESLHRVHAVVLHGGGDIAAAYGDTERIIYPRSTLKPLQAVALVESGAAAAFGVSDAELALACASHSGEEVHIKTAAGWLARLGLDENDLGCGAHAPYADVCEPAGALCNNCSGKHVGMLTLAKFMAAPTEGYLDPAHPVQQMILATLADLCGLPLSATQCGIDGCSAPNPAMPLSALARGFAAFMRADKAGFRRGSACRHLYQAMTEHPLHIGGSKNRLDTVLMQAAGGGILSKTGAEGCYIAVIPEKDAVIALKAEDGAGRAAQAVLYALLEKHALAAADVLDTIRPLCLPTLQNWRGTATGDIRVAPFDA
ncbi:MAG: asparaginase [Alphaproteobacteria bacterium]|nr:asparaginase [Alphaproteobacteria bacterium]